MSDTATAAPRAPRNYDVPTMVQAVMDLRRVNQGEIARVIGEHQTTVSRRLRNAPGFTWDELVAIADHLGVEVEFFFQDPAVLLKLGSTSARLSHSHLRALPSIQDRRLRSPMQPPMLAVVTDDH